MTQPVEGEFDYGGQQVRNFARRRFLCLIEKEACEVLQGLEKSCLDLFRKAAKTTRESYPILSPLTLIYATDAPAQKLRQALEQWQFDSGLGRDPKKPKPALTFEQWLDWQGERVRYERNLPIEQEFAGGERLIDELGITTGGEYVRHLFDTRSEAVRAQEKDYLPEWDSWLWQQTIDTLREWKDSGEITYQWILSTHESLPSSNQPLVLSKEDARVFSKAILKFKVADNEATIIPPPRPPSGLPKWESYIKRERYLEDAEAFYRERHATFTSGLLKPAKRYLKDMRRYREKQGGKVIFDHPSFELHLSWLLLDTCKEKTFQAIQIAAELKGLAVTEKAIEKAVREMAKIMGFPRPDGRRKPRNRALTPTNSKRH